MSVNGKTDSSLGQFFSRTSPPSPPSPPLVHLLTVTLLVSGAISTAHSPSRQMDISARRRSHHPHPEQASDPLDRPLAPHNGTFHKDTVLLSRPFDKMLHWVFDNEVEKGRSSKERSLRLRLGERFAFRKRLQFALLPIMYKMGVMTTLLTGLTVLVLKGLTIGVILLIFAFGNYLTKLHKHSSFQSHLAQPIHVHVHSQDGHKVTSFPSAVGPWDRVADEVHPSAYLRDDDLESYRRRLIQNSAAAMLNFKPIL